MRAKRFPCPPVWASSTAESPREALLALAPQSYTFPTAQQIGDKAGVSANLESSKGKDFTR